LKLELSLACPSTAFYLKPLDLADTPLAPLGSGHGATTLEEKVMGITRVEVSGRLALACRGCGEIIVFMGRESDWFEPDADGRPRSFVCSGCGGRP